MELQTQNANQLHFRIPSAVQNRRTKTRKNKKPLIVKNECLPWSKADAEIAFRFENEYREAMRNFQIVLKFPDIELSHNKVENIHPNIDKVNFRGNFAPRYCLIQLTPDADIEQVIKELSETPLPGYSGKCPIVEKCAPRSIDSGSDLLTSIDPNTLYVGNLPFDIDMEHIKAKVPRADRIYVGFGKKCKFTRYAFIRFKSVKDSIDAFNQFIGCEMDNRSLILRFKRHRELKRSPLEASLSDIEDDEQLHFTPRNTHEVVSDQSDLNSYEEVYNEDEYDMAELNRPIPRHSSAIKRYLDEIEHDQGQYRDYDVKRNVTVLPDDVMSVRTTSTLLDVDFPYE